jgi:hypothetical protein
MTLSLYQTMAGRGKPHLNADNLGDGGAARAAPGVVQVWRIA